MLVSLVENLESIRIVAGQIRFAAMDRELSSIVRGDKKKTRSAKSSVAAEQVRIQQYSIRSAWPSKPLLRSSYVDTGGRSFFLLRWPHAGQFWQKGQSRESWGRWQNWRPAHPIALPPQFVTKQGVLLVRGCSVDVVVVQLRMLVQCSKYKGSLFEIWINLGTSIFGLLTNFSLRN